MYYDLNEIKAVPCRDIAEKYGIQLKKVGNRLWGKLRPERTASFAIRAGSNRWDDFGLGESGSNIDLVMKLENVDKTEAINIIAEDFGIAPERFEGTKWRPLSDSKYKELGIEYPERATLNFGYDLGKHTPEQLERWNLKYGMPIKILAERYPDVYNKLIEKFAIEKITALRDVYYNSLQSYNQLLDEKNEFFIKSNLKDLKESINNKVDLLQRAVTTFKKKYDYLKVDLEHDLLKLADSTINNDQLVYQKSINEGDLIVDTKGNYYLISEVHDTKADCFNIKYKHFEEASVTDIFLDLEAKLHGAKRTFIDGSRIYHIEKDDINKVLETLDSEKLKEITDKVELFKSKNLLQDSITTTTNTVALNFNNSMVLTQKLNNF